MFSFKDWYTQEKQKPWKANKEEIVDFWKKLPTPIPIQPYRPIPSSYKGSTYSFDGVRVTGSGQFVNAIASRLKDLLHFDGGSSKLNLLYRQQVNKEDVPIPNSYVFYAKIKGNK